MAEILTSKSAAALISACLKMSYERDYSIAVAVVDAGGNLLAFQRDDKTFLAAIDIAIAKATTANAFQRATTEMQNTLEQGKFSYLSLPDAVVLEGGMPIVIGSRCLGGLGVCGAPSAVDHEIAAAAVSGFKPNQP